MVKLYAFFALSLIAQQVFSQEQLFNPGFENWDTTGYYLKPFNWEDGNPRCPTDGVPPTPPRRTSESYTGDYAVKLITSECSGPLAGYLRYGWRSFGYPPFTHYYTVSTMPTALEFFYRYEPNGNDTASVEIILFQVNDSSVKDTLGYNKVGMWQRM